MVSCKICGKEFEKDKSLHLHIKAHKLSIEQYYQQNFPRHDLHTKELIKYKNKDQYFSSDFNNKRNLKSWLKSIPNKQAQEYCAALLQKRKEEKGLVYAPTQVELRTLPMPPIQYYELLFDSYYKLCKKIGYKNKFKCIPTKKEYEETYSDDHLIYIDSREQKPLEIEDFPTEVRGLKFGDYCLNDKEKTQNTYIERKSVPDLIGTLSSGLERFKNEINSLKINCKCRKPKNGLFKHAIRELNIDIKKSYVIGDQLSDYLASQKTNLKFIGVNNTKLFKANSIFNKKNLYSAVKFIFSNNLKTYL